MKKYKKVKNNEVISISTDIGSLMHLICGSYTLLKVNTETFTDIWGDMLIEDNNTSEEILLSVINNVEQKIKEILETKPLYDMIYFSRRIFPSNIFNCLENEILIYRFMMCLAFLKYCNNTVNYVERKIDDSILPNYLEGINVLDLYNKKDNTLKLFTELNLHQKQAILCAADRLNICYQIEKLCYYLMYLTKTYRTICKGAQLSYSQKMGYVALSNEKLLLKTSLYDKRNKLSNILSPIGGYADLDTYNLNNIDKLKYYFICYQENLNKINVKNFLNKHYKQLFLVEDEFISNYIPFTLDISEYYNYVSNFGEEFKEYYMFTIEDFIIFFLAIHRGNLLETSKNEKMATQMFQRGYTSYKYNIVRESYIENYELIADEFGFLKEPFFAKEKTFSRIYQLLSFRYKNRGDINLKAIGPNKIFYRLDSECGLIDYTRWLSILEEILIPVCKDSDEKGNVFENIVIKEVIKIFGEDVFWVNQKELKANGMKREIDVSFIYEDLLIILECKAVNMSISLYVGDRKAVEFRESKNKKFISQADKTLKFIKENSKDLNYKIPKHIKGVLSLIITPSVEYLWEIKDELMINDSLPRIISLMELKRIKYKHLFEDIKNKPFFINSLNNTM